MQVQTRKIVFIALGWLFVCVAVIGIFLPLLPTTPFLLLAAWCFNRGSERFYNWLIQHPKFGPPILEWQDHRVIRTPFKILATTMLVGSGAYLHWKGTVPLSVRIIHLSISVTVLIFIWRQKGAPKIQPSSNETGGSQL